MKQRFGKRRLAGKVFRFRGPLLGRFGLRRRLPHAEVLLEVLLQGMTGLSDAKSAALLEAASVCFLRRHVSPTMAVIHSNGGMEKASLVWREPVDVERSCRTWADEKEATAEGAAGVAIGLVRRFRGMVVVDRSAIGSGFDYYVQAGDSSSDIPFVGMTRLEVSGILRGGSKEIGRRTKKKVKQISVSNDWGMPAIISIVDFTSPAATLDDQ